MVNVTLEIMKKELTSYYNQKSAILRNVLFLVLFGALTLYQLTKVVGQYSPSALIISSALNVLLALAAIFPVNMASGISVMAFPVERDQKTLEHLLSLPLKDREIFMGKFLAAVVSGIAGLALMLAIIFGFVLFNYGISPGDILTVGPLSLMAFGVCPLLVVMLILATVIISSHISARETYVVNVISMFILLGLNTAVAALNIDMATVNYALMAILLPLIVIMYVIGTKTFNRESLIKSL